MLKALEYLSKDNNRMIHRDIKLKNILLKNNYSNHEIGLCDFGLCCSENKKEKHFSYCGTPGYVAPEILKKKAYTKKVDIFSLGVILY